MAEEVDRREFAKLLVIAGVGATAGFASTTVEEGSGEEVLLAGGGGGGSEQSVAASNLADARLIRATDTQDYKQHEPKTTPAIYLVESGQYQGIQLHT